MQASSRDLRERIVRAVEQGRSQRAAARLCGCLGWEGVRSSGICSSGRARAAWPGTPFQVARSVLGPSRRRSYAPGWKPCLRPRWRSRVRGGRLSRVSASAARPCGGRSVGSAGPEKRSVGVRERDEMARAAWRTQLSQIDGHRLVFVDESGTHTSLARLLAWALRGQRAVVQVPRPHGKNTPLFAALTRAGVQAPWAVGGHGGGGRRGLWP